MSVNSLAQTESTPILSVKNLHKQFKDLQVLKGVDLQVSKGDVIAVIGPSGCGKSTFLRCLNLLETPTSGEILLEGEHVFKNENVLLKPHLLQAKKQLKTAKKENFSSFSNKYCILWHHSVYFGIVELYSLIYSPIGEILNEQRNYCEKTCKQESRSR